MESYQSGDVTITLVAVDGGVGQFGDDWIEWEATIISTSGRSSVSREDSRVAAILAAKRELGDDIGWSDAEDDSIHEVITALESMRRW
jgi:hypothetical protein